MHHVIDPAYPCGINTPHPLMTRIRTLALIAMACPVFALHAQNSFEIKITVPDLTNVAGGHELPDGSFVFGAELGDGVIVLRTDTSGEVLWTRALADAANDEGLYDHSIAVMNDRILMGGYAMGPNTSSRDGILHVLNMNGDVLYQRIIDVGFNSNAVHTLTGIGDGALIAGRASGAGSYDMLLERVDSNGTVLDSWSYGSAGWDWAYEAIRCFDGGMALVGYGDSLGGPAPNAYLVRTGAQGEELWARGVDGASADEGYTVTEDPVTGDLYIGGRTLGMGGPGLRGFITKFTSDGTHVWTRVINNAFDPIGITPLSNGRFAALLRAQNIPGGHGDYDALIVIFDGMGTLLGNHLFGTAASEYPVSLSRTSGGDLLITCLRSNPGGIYAVLVNSNGIGGCTGTSVDVSWVVYSPTIIDHTSDLNNGYSAGDWSTGVTTPALTREFVCCAYPVNASFTMQPTGDPLTWDFTSTATGAGTLTWTIDGNSYSGPSAQHTFAQPGTYTACLGIEGLCATDDTCQTVSTNGDAVDERPENTGLRLWPQPASDYLQLSSNSPMRAIELFDAAGRIVRHSAVNGQRFIQLDVQGSAPGAYLLRAWTDAGPVHRRWIKR